MSLPRLRMLRQAARDIRQDAQYTDSAQARTVQLDRAAQIDAEAKLLLDSMRLQALNLPPEYLAALDVLIGVDQ